MTAAQQVESQHDMPVPTLRPDPALIDNSEGNETLLRRDREAAEAYLESLDPQE